MLIKSISVKLKNNNTLIIPITEINHMTQLLFNQIYNNVNCFTPFTIDEFTGENKQYTEHILGLEIYNRYYYEVITPHNKKNLILHINYFKDISNISIITETNIKNLKDDITFILSDNTQISIYDLIPILKLNSTSLNNKESDWQKIYGKTYTNQCTLVFYKDKRKLKHDNSKLNCRERIIINFAKDFGVDVS